MNVAWRKNTLPLEISIPLGLIVGVAIIEFIGLLNPVKSFLERFVSPVLTTNVRLQQMAGSPVALLRSRAASARRIQDLEYRYAEVTAQLGELEALKKENETLREFVNRVGNDAQQTKLTAPLISLAYPAIGAGSVEGILPGQMVLVAGTLVGTINEVADHQSTVAILTQKNTTSVLAQVEDGVQGLVIGDGQRVLLTEIPLDVELQPGQRVLTVGQPGIANTIFIGRIVKIETDLASPVQTAVLDQGVSFYQARLVEIR